MSTLSAFLPVAGCAVMMLVCARMMRHGHDHPTADAADDQPLHPSEVAQLRAEVEQLRAQLDGDEQRADREAER